MHKLQFVLMVFLLCASFGLQACGQKVPLKQDFEEIEDSNAY